MATLKITAELIPEDEGGYTIYCPELDIYTQGDSEVAVYCVRSAKREADVVALVRHSG